ALGGTRGRKQALAQHDDEHYFELQTLRRMNGRELDLLRVVRWIILGLDIGEQGELREKFLNAAELKRELGQLLDFVEPAFVVVVSLLEIIVVTRIHYQPQHLRRALARAG